MRSEGWKIFMKGHNLHQEAFAHINTSVKLISVENALDKNPRKSFTIIATAIFWENVYAYVHMYVFLIELFLTFDNKEA
jgi:hypothetical protein